jgi:hypothetical protein
MYSMNKKIAGDWHPFFLWLSLVVCLLVTDVRAQTAASISLVVADEVDRSPLAYINVYNKSSNTGTATNANGYCTIPFNQPGEWIRFTSVGYKTREIKAGLLQGVDTLYMEPQATVLPEFNLSANEGYYIQFFTKLKSSNKVAALGAKTYFLLETYQDNEQMEMVEVYFNGQYHGYNIEQLDYKEGRIALKKLGTHYFVSTGISKTFYNFNVFEADGLFPKNPLQMNTGELKKKYHFSLSQKYIDEGGHLVHAIKFYPKKEKSALFEGCIWIDSARSLIQKIQLTAHQTAVYPFLPLFPNDSVAGVNLEMNISFNEWKGGMVFDHLSFGYNFIYYPRDGHPYTIRSTATLHAYDFAQRFILPLYGAEITSTNDYRYVSSTPYNRVFWNDLKEFRLHAENNRNDVFFNEPGIVNSESFFGDNMAINRGFFQDPFLFWSNTRIQFRRLPEDSLKNKNTLGLMPADLYHLGIDVYMDINLVNDSIQVLTATIYNPFTTFFYFPMDAWSDCFLNLYFDMVEIERRALVAEINHTTQDAANMRTIYFTRLKAFKTLADGFFMETEHGTNPEGMVKWNKYVEAHLGINNMQIFGLVK